MKLTAASKAWLVAECGVSQDATEDELKSKAAEALTNGELSADKFADLQKEVVSDAAPLAGSPQDVIAGIVGDAIKGALAPVQDQLTQQGEFIRQLQGGVHQTVSDVDKSSDASDQAAEEIVSAAASVTRGVGQAAAAVLPQSSEPELREFGLNFTKLAKNHAGTDGADVPGGSAVRYIGAERRYDDTKSRLSYPEKHPLSGQPASFADRPLYSQSELDKATIGAWFKFALWVGGGQKSGNCPRALQPTEHDMQLVRHALHEMPFTGLLRGEGMEQPGCTKVDNRKLHEGEIKALLDDTTSGGLEVAPIVFDSAIITTPVLFGELFPLVNLVNIARGRRIEGASIGNPTFTSGTAEGTAIGLFSTASFVSAFDTTIFNAVGAMEIGMDFEEDSPVGVGSIVAQKYGEKAMEWLDTQIAAGDGTTEPEGVTVASGVTDIDWGGDAATVSDYEGHLFGIAKEFRDPATRDRQVFCSNETSYQRSRSIAVGTGDQRRVFGVTHEDYALLGHPYKIVHGLGNADVFFGNMSRYRMYRRLGLNVRFESAGQTLALKNTRLIIVRMRYGGQIEDASAFVLTDSAQA